MTSPEPGSAPTPRPTRKRQSAESATSEMPQTAALISTTEAPIAVGHLTRANSQHLASLRKERAHLLEQNAAFRAEVARQKQETDEKQKQLDTLRPELARVRAELRNLTGNAQISAVFVACGGAGLSAAGYLGSFWRSGVIGAGIAALLCGISLQLRIAGFRESAGAAAGNEPTVPVHS